MPLSSVLVEEALEEFLEATSYLEDKSPGLGEKFNLAFVEAVEMLLTFPEIGYELKRYQVRRFGLRGFSYNIIYRIEEDNLVIYALAHQKRRPGYWSNRLN
jgi:plasmid stabilization system protein ParE